MFNPKWKIYVNTKVLLERGQKECKSQITTCKQCLLDTAWQLHRGLMVVVTAHARPSQAQDRPNFSIDRGIGTKSHS